MNILGHSEFRKKGEPGAESAEVQAPDSSAERQSPSVHECQETKDVNKTAESNDGETQSGENEKKPITDDDGNEISDNDGNLKPNNTYQMFGVEYKTDDNGKEYSIDGELKPNDTFVIDGKEYKTDDNGTVYMVDGQCIPGTSYVLDGKHYPGSPEGYHRPYLRDDVKKQIYDNAPKDSEGRPIDPNTGIPIEGTPDIGHKPGHEHRREAQNAYDDNLSQEEFNDKMNDSNLYQLEDPHNNRSHQYEDHSPVKGEKNEDI